MSPRWAGAQGSDAGTAGRYAGILDEAITNIDDVSRRDEKSTALRSLRKLTASGMILAPLTALKGQVKDPENSPPSNASQICEPDHRGRH